MDYNHFLQREMVKRVLFERAYGPPLAFDDPRGGARVILDEGAFVCRYCGRGVGDGAPFEKKAHLVPEMLGNRTILSDGECDDCNERFSGYELQLRHYLGASRVWALVEGKKRGGSRIRPFTDAATGSTMQVAGDQLVLNLSIVEDSVVVDDETKRGQLDAVTAGFVPLGAWAAISRIAVGVMDHDDLASFTWLREMVGPEPSLASLLRATPQMFWLMWFTIPGGGPLFDPIRVELYPRRTERLDVSGTPGGRPFAKALVLKFGRYVFQLAIPSNEDIEAVRRGVTLAVVPYPVVYPRDEFERFGDYDLSKDDLCDPNYTPSERRTIRFGWTGDRVILSADDAEAHLASLGLTLEDLGLSRRGDSLRTEAS